MDFLDSLSKKIIKTHASDISGNYHFTRKNNDSIKQIHLRVEEDGSGTLLINASNIFYFNASATIFALSILNKEPEQGLIRKITSQYKLGKTQARSDFNQFRQNFLPIISPLGDACPICDLNFDTIQPFSQLPTAPFRMDLAITYRCNNACIHCYNAPGRGKTELKLAEWKTIIDQIWKIGIPHIVFTGGEPTLHADLFDLIKYANSIGIITGLNTNGRRLKDKEYVQALIDAGLDHIQITLESHDQSIHDNIVQCRGAWQQTVAGIQNALQSKLFVMTNTTLLKLNSIYLKETMEFLAQLKVPTIGLNGLIYSGRGAETGIGIEENDLTALLALVVDLTQAHGQRLIWYTPTQYCHFDPVTYGLGVKGCTAASYNMCIEPDGTVLPCQSYYQPLGNMLIDEWANIWNHDLAVSIREKKHLPNTCNICNLLSECGGGCPLYLEEKVLQKNLSN